MTTRWIIAITRIAGQRILHTRSSGGRRSVLTRYISPTLRSSCCYVAIFFESGDQRHDGAIAAAPAGVVGRVAEVLHAVGRERLLLAGRQSRTQRFQSRMKAPRLPSGDIASGLPSDETCRRALGRRRGARREPPRPLAAGRGRGIGCVAVGATRDRRRADGPRPFRGIDQDCLRRSVGEHGAVPEAFVRHPVRGDAPADDQTGDGRREKRLGPRVVGRRHPAWPLLSAYRHHGDGRWRRGSECMISTCRVDPSNPVRLSC